jgi:TRAP-type C4-dicarboxylate transport system substrate-binding protein
MKRRDFVKATGLLAGAGAIGGNAIPSLAQSKTRIKFESYVTESAGPSWLDRWFLDELEKRTNGEVKIARYWAASLNKVGEHLPAVRDKTIDMSLISPGYYQADLPVTRGLEWYFRMNRADALLQVCHDVYGKFQPLRDEWEKRHRAKVMYWTNWNYAPMITRKPINGVSDLKGMRIRGYGVANDVIERLGGTGVPMAAPEVYTALERGLLDGVYGFDFITAVAYKLHEIAPHFTNMGDGPHAPAAVVINVDVWNSFPDKVKNVCNQLVEEIYGGKYSEVMTKVLHDYVKKAESEGVKFNNWNDEQKEKARKIVQPAEVNHWVETVAKPAKIDGERMQVLISEAIAKYDPKGTLLRPQEIAARA